MQQNKETQSKFMPLSRRRDANDMWDPYVPHNMDNKYFLSKGELVAKQKMIGDGEQGPYRVEGINAPSVAVPFNRSEVRVRAGAAPNQLERRRRKVTSRGAY